MLWLKMARKVIRLLGSNVAPHEIALGLAFGMVLGFTPLFSAHNLIVLFLICVVNVNISAVIVGTMIFRLAAFGLDPLFHSLGFTLLAQTQWLRPLWTVMYQTPFVPLTRFNNTVVLGSLVTCIVVFYPFVRAGTKGIVAYRTSVYPKLDKFRFYKILKGSKLYSWYMKIKKFKD